MRPGGDALVPRGVWDAFTLCFLARDMVRSPRFDVTEGGGPGRAERYSPKRDHQRLGEARRWRHHCCEHGTRNHACITGFKGSTDAAVSTVAARGLIEIIYQARPVFFPVVTHCRSVSELALDNSADHGIRGAPAFLAKLMQCGLPFRHRPVSEWP